MSTYEHSNCRLPVGTMLCAEGLAAKTILDDLKNAAINQDLFSTIASADKLYYRDGSTALHLVAEPLSTKHISSIQGFQSSYLNIANYLKDPNQAFEYDSTGQAKTTLFFDSASKHLVAYASIKCSSLRIQETNTFIYVLPALEVIMLCVDDRYKRRGIGEAVLSYIIKTTYTIRNLAGLRLITLFSVKEAIPFYKNKFSFRELSSGMQVFLSPNYINCVPMYLALPRIKVL